MKGDKNKIEVKDKMTRRQEMNLSFEEYQVRP